MTRESTVYLLVSAAKLESAQLTAGRKQVCTTWPRMNVAADAHARPRVSTRGCTGSVHAGGHLRRHVQTLVCPHAHWRVQGTLRTDLYCTDLYGRWACGRVFYARMERACFFFRSRRRLSSRARSPAPSQIRTCATRVCMGARHPSGAGDGRGFHNYGGSCGPPWLWPRIVMALHSSGPT